MKTQRKPRLNLGQIAYNEIKEMILTGELEPGERIILDTLSRNLNLSVTPIRDALNKLEQEDLVVITPRTSHSVVKIDVKGATDIIELRLTLEMYALQSAGERISGFPVQKFRNLFTRSSLRSDYKKFIKADADFHSAILAVSSNQRLPKLYSYLQNLIQVLSVQAIKADGRIAEASQEHQSILDAIEQQNLDRAFQELKNHFDQMRSALLRETL